LQEGSSFAALIGVAHFGVTAKYLEKNGEDLLGQLMLK